jgi:hypothetical protein
MDIVAARSLNSLYIYLDIIFLVLFTGLLVWKKRYQALAAGLAGCIIYFAADYGIFYSLMHTRQVAGADPMWFLLWLSISYGLTNFAWIWLLFDREGHGREWSIFIIAGWMAVALLSQSYGGGFDQITISRGTAYHGAMALIMFAGYGWLIIRNLRAAPGDRVNLLWLLAIGIGVQFSWEAVLLLTGIRPAGLMPLIVDSLVETNLGIPYLYFIHRAISRKYREDLSRVP